MMQKEPSEVLSEFLNFLDECEIRYQTAHEAVGLEDRRLQDLLHEMEFAEGENAKRRAGTKIQQSRRARRRMSDDLISRKALLEVIDISFIIPILKMNLRPEHEAVLKIREIIMNMPTAFDKEKVIEQIKVLSTGIILNTNICDDYAEGYVRAAKDIIEIVKKGGIE